MYTIADLKKVSGRHTTHTSIKMGTKKPNIKAAQGKMSSKTTANKEVDQGSFVESRLATNKGKNLKKTASGNRKDQDESRPTSRRSTGLGKRKREQEDSSEDEGEDEEDEVVKPSSKKPARQNKECAVCFELVATTSFPDTTHSGDREHGLDVCLSCWNQHIESEIRSKNFEGISCLQCSHKLVEEEVRRLTNESTYAEYVFLPYRLWNDRANLWTRYLDKGAKSCMQQDEEFQACPSATCSWGMYL
jgi:DNA-directed RNA polymerase subunit RPC12/RpoP